MMLLTVIDNCNGGPFAFTDYINRNWWVELGEHTSYLLIKVKMTANARTAKKLMEFAAVSFCTSKNATTTMTLTRSITLPATRAVSNAFDRAATKNVVVLAIAVVAAGRKKFSMINRTATIVTKDPSVFNRITVPQPDSVGITNPFTTNSVAANLMDEIDDFTNVIENTSTAITIDSSNRKQVFHFSSP
jgi:hypothetical protein